MAALARCCPALLLRLATSQQPKASAPPAMVSAAGREGCSFRRRCWGAVGDLPARAAGAMTETIFKCARPAAWGTLSGA